MVGGDFVVNTRGIDHYKEFGYKYKLCKSKESIVKDSEATSWVTIPYHCNRGILHDGDYPHLSTEITHIKETVHRVILGFNCFSKELHECCEKAPEHSKAFNRTVKLYQRMSAMGIPITVQYADGEKHTDGSSTTEVDTESTSCSEMVTQDQVKSKQKKGINIKDVMKNPFMCKMLIYAAKKVKEEEALK